ncbi:two-component system sensor histidine kinase KdpD [Sphingomonas sp. BE270]|uniref:sensor histidine kinase n=1 Tax=unclassified Sphingomonas TaxID=196159 RepID=UPI0010F9D024|nr:MULTISPECIES: sensor histidine kinase KdpD [unclassified Sphingomonas]MDR6846858.1 two-component system sensor histidine kinase KdpD [Sphingomonas sp. BE137]MDR7256536.1 two-component system sensor histidine kinase KdpD [Sphingomonas sp. BE270]
MNETRPSPDALLKAAQREGRGRLKIFLGAAPGVGKTFEMLREGAELLRTGTDVVAGVIETHGRTETERLTAPFEVLPRAKIVHGAHTLEEFDLDAMLKRHPQVALIDEFAHTNAPGSRHPKRWQDIEELRAAGIDVLTTLNIQHVESLNDVVAGFTRVRVRETVPDAVLDDAEIEVVDLPPDELIDRLKDGKVYIPAEATRALGHFFSKSNLSALRELALRRAAQTVDRHLLDHVASLGESGTWAGGERVVVAVGDQPGSETLIRSAKRLADALRASWTAVVVETPRTATLSAEARARMAHALDLATGLGATIATIPARSVLEGLVAQIREARATAVVIGKSRRSWWFELRHGSIVDRLVRALDGVAIHVVPVAQPSETLREAPTTRPILARGSLIGLALVGANTALATLLQPLVGANAMDLLYLLPVIATATLYGLRPSLIASIGAALAYNFFFLPPLYTLTITDPQNVVTLIVFVIVAVVASQLAGQVRREANLGARTATENAALAAFGQRLAAVADETGTATATCEETAALLGVSTVLLGERDGRHVAIAGAPDVPQLSPIDLAAADWAFDRGEVTGRASGTLTASAWQFHPLKTALGVLGVLGVARDGDGDPIPADKRVLFATLVGQAALAHERLQLEAQAREVSALKQRDDLRATLLSSIGHDLKTPLTAVVAAADQLASEYGASPTTATLQSEARRLRRVFDDLVEMTRIEAGALVMRQEATDLTDAVAAAAHDLRAELARHRLILDVPPTLPLVEADPRMLHHVLINLLGNAAKFAPADTDIIIEGRRTPDGLTLGVLDQGPGLPPGREAHLFDRFTRVDGDDRSGGTGLGLAIVQGFAQAMGLSVSASNRETGGSAFCVTWPNPLIRRTAAA